MELDTLKETVIKLLITDHGFTIDEAEESVSESMRLKPELWGENSDPNDLANFLASDENDD